MTEQVKVTQADKLCAQSIRQSVSAATSDMIAARHRIAAQAELLEALEDAERGLLAITVALAEQEFSRVAQKVGAYAERAGAAIAKAKGEV